MIVLASVSEMGVGKFSRPQRAVGVLEMPDAGQDTTQHVESVCEVPPSARVLRLNVPGVAVRAFIDHRSVADGVATIH